jgi:hypothetical protein
LFQRSSPSVEEAPWVSGRIEVQPHAKSGSRKWPINHQRHQHKAMAMMTARWIADPDRAMQTPKRAEGRSSETYELHDLFWVNPMRKCSTKYRLSHRTNYFTCPSWLQVTIFPKLFIMRYCGKYSFIVM